MLKSIHSTKVKDGEFPDIKQLALEWVDEAAGHIPEEQRSKLRALIEAVPKQNTLLHGDYHTNNIMIQNGEPVLIDMDTLCMGHPVFELGAIFNAFIGYAEHDHGNIMEFFGFSFETSVKFWNTILKMYLGTDDEAVCQSVAEKAMLVGYTRMLRRAIRRPNDAESPVKIARCKEMIALLLNKVDTLIF
jgi:thiamine kinase-like enzyme